MPETALAELSESAQNHLKAIWSEEEDGGRVTAKRLGRRLGMSPSTVSEGLRRLVSQEFVEHAPYGEITLTELGRRHAVAMVRRHRLLETYLATELGYGWDEVHDEAERLEHAVSDRLIAEMDRRLGYPDRDPHGDPIPAPDGAVQRRPDLTVAALPEGARAAVYRVADTDPEILRHLADLGIGVDETVTMVARQDFAGTVRVLIGSADEPVDLGVKAADAISVTPAPRFEQDADDPATRRDG